jgi:hypothetical protein
MRRMVVRLLLGAARRLARGGRLRVPSGGAARIWPAPGGRAVVILAPRPDLANPRAALAQSRTVLLQLGDGQVWPDAEGQAVGYEVLAEGGIVAFEFPELGAALEFQRRLEAAR